MKRKILVFGATGEIGMYFVDYLHNALNLDEYEIVAISRRKTNFFERYNITYYSIDIAKEDGFSDLPQDNVYAVVLLAAMIPAKMEGYNPKQYFEVNTIGGLNVLEYCKKVSVRKIIFTQTIREIGKYMGHGIIPQDAKRDFLFIGDHAAYTISKNVVVDLLEHYYQEYGLERYVFRIPTIYLYSPNKYYYVDGIKRQMGFRTLIDKAIRGEKIEIWGNPRAAHDIVYIKDLCQLFLNVLLMEQDNGGVYNVGTGNPVSIENQIRGIVEVFSEGKERSEITYAPDKRDSRSYTFNIDELKSKFNYKVNYDYIQYLNDFKKEMEQNRFKDLF